MKIENRIKKLEKDLDYFQKSHVKLQQQVINLQLKFLEYKKKGVLRLTNNKNTTKD